MNAGGIPQNYNGKTSPPLLNYLRMIKKDIFLYIMLLPGVLFYIVFKFIPMYGIIIAFQNYSLGRGVLGSKWVGLAHFIKFFNVPDAWIIIRNTFLMNVYELIFAFPAPIILALLFNELRSMLFKRVVQTISYLPHFISTVIVAGMVVNFLSPSSGIVNQIMVKFLGFEKPIFFMSEPGWFRTIYIASGIWQGIGWGTIIYLASIAGINPVLYEAAKIDGANRFHQVWHITVKGIIPVIMVLFILNIGNILSVSAQKIILMYNPMVYETADVINSYVYRRGILGADFSFATAVGLFQSVVGFFLVVMANNLSRRFSETSLW